MTKREKMELDAWNRWLAANWTKVLGGNLAMIAKLHGRRWIHTGRTIHVADDCGSAS